jgi:hypothetical protein
MRRRMHGMRRELGVSPDSRAIGRRIASLQTGCLRPPPRCWKTPRKRWLQGNRQGRTRRCLQTTETG